MALAFTNYHWHPPFLFTQDHPLDTLVASRLCRHGNTPLAPVIIETRLPPATALCLTDIHVVVLAGPYSSRP